jgi:hypothetical protein
VQLAIELATVEQGAKLILSAETRAAPPHVEQPVLVRVSVSGQVRTFLKVRFLDFWQI